jgi:hypothetical protein
VRRSPTRALATAAALAGVVLGWAVIPAGGAPVTTYETKVRISERPPAFHGRVQSTFEPCEKRRVRLLKKRVEDNKLMGKDRTDGKGEWKVSVEELTLKSGAYFAKTARKKVGRKLFVCEADRSRPIVID